MAMNTGTRARSSRTAATEAVNKADGFLNFYLPTKGGGKWKVGFQALYRAKSERDAALIAWLEADPANVQSLVGKDGKLIVEYRSAEITEGSELDL